MAQYSLALPVLHPALRLSWFKSIDNDAYERAKEVLEYHYSEYAETMPTSVAPPSTNVSSSTSDNSFLASIARRPIASTSTPAAQPAPKPVSERERYLTLEHGKMDFEALNAPLLWWKVRSLMRYVIYSFLTQCSS